MEFLSSCLLQGKYPTKRPDRKLELQGTFYLGKQKKSMVQRQRSRLPPRVSFYRSLFGFLPTILSFLYHPLDLPCSPSAPLHKLMSSFPHEHLCENHCWGPNCDINDIIMVSGLLATRFSLSALFQNWESPRDPYLLLISLC